MSEVTIFVREVETMCAALISECCFRVTDQRYDSSFGNGFVLFESNQMMVRVVRDRGRFRFEVAARQERDRWFDVEIVMSHLGLPSEVEATTTQPDVSTLLRNWVVLFVENCGAIAELFSPEEFPSTRPNLEKLEWDRARRVFGTHVEHLSSE